MKKTYTNEIFIISIVIIAAVAMFIVKGNGMSNIIVKVNPPNIPYEVPEEDQHYEVKIELTPNPVCISEKVTGRIYSNMPNAVCRIWYQVVGNEPQKLTDTVLDSTGSWEHTHTFSTSGSVDFKAVCMLGDRWAQSNKERLDVVSCGSTTTTIKSTTTISYEGMPCEQVPPGQETCSQGYCGTGTCTFVPGNLVTPDSCVCK